MKGSRDNFSKCERILWRVLVLLCVLAPGALAQDEVAEFKKRAAQLAGQRLGGADADRSVQDAALAILDAMVCQGLTSRGGASLDAINARLAELVTQDPAVGEDYRVLALAAPRLYALVANLSLAGPAVLRLYVRDEPAAGAKREQPAGCRLAAQIDRFTQPDFFDENLDLVPISAVSAAEADAVFVTVSGRSDDLRTGAFMAWRFHQEKLEVLWTSDILQDSSYEAAPGVFHVTFCSEPDEVRPRICRRMVRERYTWERGAWSRIEQTDVPARKP